MKVFVKNAAIGILVSFATIIIGGLQRGRTRLGG